MAKMEHIITVEEVRKTGRPIGHVDASQLQAFITEAEQMYIKPTIGNALFMQILNEGEDKEDIKTLLDGGTYEDRHGCTSSFVGLRTALSYFVYAQNVMCGDFQSTRYGMVIKDSDYSQPLSDKNRSAAYNNALEVAKAYLKECVTYCKAKGLITSSGRPTAAGSVRIRKIG